MTNVMTKQTSRQRILSYLDQHNGSSAEEISRTLRVTASNVRYHLNILEADHRVLQLGFRPENGPGRPVAIYGSVKTAARDNLAGLVNSLLESVWETVEEGNGGQFIENLAAKLVPVEAGEGAGSIMRRLTQTVTRLSKLGYAPRWEAHAAAPRIIFEHCPYADVISKHPELCRVDKAILQQQLGGQIDQTAKLEKNARGILFCQFILRKY